MAVTQKQAEAALAAVEEKYKGYWGEQAVEDGFEMPKPKLVKDWTFVSSSAPFAIVWEDGPYEWAYRTGPGEVNEETFSNIFPEFETDRAKAREMATEKGIETPKGLFLEPITSWALGIYEA